MTGGTVETRIHAADTIVDLVTRRRTSTGDLAAALVTAAPAAVLTRWHETLQHVGAAGHPDITIAMLSIVIPTLPRGQRGLHALLDLLHQELLRAHRGVIEPSLREHLSTFAGSSKATRTARAILAIQ